MFRRNEISKIVLALFLIGPCVVLGQTNLTTSPLGGIQHPPSPPCRSVQLLALDGVVVANQQVHIKVMHWDFSRPHTSSIVIEWKSVKIVKTDARGQLQLPKLNPGTYQFNVKLAKKDALGAFEVPSEWAPQICTEPWVMEDKGEYVDIHPAHPAG